MIKPIIEELNEKCELHRNQNMLQYTTEPMRTEIGKFCPMCQMMGIPEF